jgi:hypothetical protein
MLARQQRHVRITDTSVTVGGRLAQLDERVPPEVGLQRVAHQLLEPCLVEVVQRRLVLVPLFVHDLERLGHDEAPALLDATREVQVNLHVPVDVVEPLAVRAVHVDGELPGVAPVLDVLPGQRVGGALQLDDHFLHALAVSPFGEVEVPVWRVQHVPCL